MTKLYVGIDVAKGKSTVVILRPFGEIVVSPYEVKHTDSEITALIKRIKAIDGETRIVMEHTGHYYEQLLIRFAEAGLFATAVNPKWIKDFSTNSLRKVKTDKVNDKYIKYIIDGVTVNCFDPSIDIEESLILIGIENSSYLKCTLRPGFDYEINDKSMEIIMKKILQSVRSALQK